MPFAVFQLLHENTSASDAKWDNLSQSVSSLRDQINPAAAALLAEQLRTQREK